MTLSWASLRLMARLASGCDPLTADDIAEVIVFAASRRQNVVIADTLVFPNHQVRIYPLSLLSGAPLPTYAWALGGCGCYASTLDLKGKAPRHG